MKISVALHELAGHGSGKLFKEKETGGFNFDPAKVKNPFTGSDIITAYKATETYS